MTAVQRAICALDEILPLAWGAKVPIYIICSCSNLNMEEAKIELSIPHVRLDLTHETGCLAMSSLTSQKRKDPIIRMREEILKKSEKNHQVFTPILHYGCRFYNYRMGIELPLFTKKETIED